MWDSCKIISAGQRYAYVDSTAEYPEAPRSQTYLCCLPLELFGFPRTSSALEVQAIAFLVALAFLCTATSSDAVGVMEGSCHHEDEIGLH